MDHKTQIARHAQLFELLRQQHQCKAAATPAPVPKRSEKDTAQQDDLLRRAAASFRQRG